MRTLGGGPQNSSESTWGKISKQFKQLTDKVAKGAQKIAFNMGVYGASVDVYARALLELFRETYFVEQWIVELELHQKTGFSSQNPTSASGEARAFTKQDELLL